MINAIIMASGSSRRMGRNKLLLPYQNKKIIEHTLDKVMMCGFKKIILVAQDEEILKLGRMRGLTCIYNAYADKGQSESIKLGVKHSTTGLGYVFFTGDQPLMDVNSIMFLIEHFKKSPESIVIPVYDNQKGSPVFFPNRFKDDFLALSGDIGGKVIIDNNKELINYVNINNPYFLWDIDTFEDYNKLLMLDEKR